MNDIILDDNMDLSIIAGDFVVDDCENQIQQILLIAQPGNFRDSPLTGVGIINYLKGQLTPSLVDSLTKKIQIQWQYDGYAGVNVVVNSFTDIEIVANR
jgi:hypothetical protein